MPVPHNRFKRIYISVATLLLLLITGSATQPGGTLSAKADKGEMIYLPLMRAPVTRHSDGIAYTNQFRARANVPAAVVDHALESNCLEHARYMVENDHITHHQNNNLPFATTSGQLCAERANAWLGTAHDIVEWNPHDPIRGWMSSVPHRLWLIYPTMKSTGYGFYMDENSHRAAAAIDVLSGADFAADEAYAHWPIRYPGPGQMDVPTIPYAITLHWRYFGSKPEIKGVRLTTLEGTPIPFEANTDLPINHKGIQILPKHNLPGGTTFLVTVQGYYAGQPFTYEWQFATGSTSPWGIENLGGGESMVAHPDFVR